MPEHLLSTAAMRQADARTIAAGIPGVVLMERAGAAVAGAAVRLVAPRDPILVVCGPGNNGGDGFVAARLLAEQGYAVTVTLVGSRAALSGDATLAASTWPGSVEPPFQVRPERSALVIDALFGAGLTRDVTGDARELVERINASGVPVLAVDVPSGLDGDTGQVRGAAVRADRTVTFATRKPGHLLLPGRLLCGPVEVADIGIARETIAAVGDQTFVNGPDLWGASLPRPSRDTHKYERGHTLVASGGATRTGASRLAARAALRIGSGLVTVASPPEALGINAAQLTAIMVRGCDGPDGLDAILQDRRFNALVLGPALGVHAATRTMVVVAVEARRSLVLDADALTSFEGLAPELAGVFGEAPTVLTPHDGEFARLFKGLDHILEAASKLDRARRAAAYLGAVMVLKGPDTVIAAPDGRASINENGTPYLATAGSGDVLSGIIAGLMAQGLPAFEAAAAGVWIHAEAGEAFGPGLIAEDLPDLLPGVLRRLL
ncbi:MAG TPA: NAD(P)H-hydrate dehydratase [Microvirga sp.]|jgi:NAD(P)H-hydrate epimerase